MFGVRSRTGTKEYKRRLYTCFATPTTSLETLKSDNLKFASVQVHCSPSLVICLFPNGVVRGHVPTLFRNFRFAIPDGQCSQFIVSKTECFTMPMRHETCKTFLIASRSPSFALNIHPPRSIYKFIVKHLALWSIWSSILTLCDITIHTIIRTSNTNILNQWIPSFLSNS